MKVYCWKWNNIREDCFIQCGYFVDQYCESATVLEFKKMGENVSTSHENSIGSDLESECYKKRLEKL